MGESTPECCAFSFDPLPGACVVRRYRGWERGMTILLAILTALVSIAAVGLSAYNIGECRGYRDGWEEGYSDGLESGYDDGQLAGLRERRHETS